MERMTTMTKAAGLLMAALMLGASCGAGAQAMPMAGHDQMGAKTSRPSTSLVVTIDSKATTLSLDDLKAMPQKTLTVKNGHSQAEETYTGVAVGDVLAKLGFAFESATAKKVYRSYVKAEGTDGYWVLYSASELMPILRDDASLIAIAMDGKPLAAEGAFKIVIAGEKRPARWVRNLKGLTVVTVE